MKKVKTLTNKAAQQLKQQEQANQLREQLTIGPDLLIERKGSDEKLDQRLTKVELINGTYVNLKEMRDYINGKIHDYGVKFYQEFYHNIFRLNGWTIPENGKIKLKPSIVADWTKTYIYGRFPKEILPNLEEENEFNELMGRRLHKHFHLLTPAGIVHLEKFIYDSVEIMKRCKTWDEFVREHAIAYGHPFQTSLFS